MTEYQESELERIAKRFVKCFMPGIQNILNCITKISKTIKKYFEINCALRQVDPKIRKLALHHPKARVRKKNVNRAIREYRRKRRLEK